eukprot:CAMPEP_0170171462 /NCGR_PEP_ID=MMETSP0040_2-20121228/4602_1 /TAXON_ID=641309 /ORGANISM="Lotharella oceanica, Strain CCMP622" /LENGTH=86 /DNA_ID=CAMNT_0010411523 /DNA_START=443 /DNA_END=704 /DNA_ORIENTATION=-
MVAEGSCVEFGKTPPAGEVDEVGARGKQCSINDNFLGAALNNTIASELDLRTLPPYVNTTRGAIGILAAGDVEESSAGSKNVSQQR